MNQTQRLIIMGLVGGLAAGAAIGIWASVSAPGELPAGPPPAELAAQKADAEAEAAEAAQEEQEEVIRPGSWKSRTPAPEVTRAYELMRNNQVAEAQALIDARLEAAPDDPEAQLIDGGLHLHAKRFDEAVASFQKARELDPSFTEAITWEAAAHVDAKRCPDALPLLDEAVAAWPDDPTQYFNRGHCHFITRDYDAALEDSQKACDMGLERACKTRQRVEARKAHAEKDQAAAAEHPAPSDVDPEGIEAP